MAKQPNKTQAGTNVQQVKQQNAQAGQAQQQFGTEFASETNAQEVKQQNQQSAAKKAQASGGQNQGQQR
ncbi:gamma-type small acid-soluble spore protein [Rossellomorea sp. BNER]|uniref:gamma-type small acid-soluble spore protein n=1 Tax=Rossellomorea sp. BNER TaxID=2962031 RepID=UPI003AF2234C|nr:gamma-type small acid-soluble spore protein [Rossellomorea sp. BNER]